MFTCVKCKESFKIKKFYLCPKCLQLATVDPEVTHNQTIPILVDLIFLCQTREQELQKNHPDWKAEVRFYSVLRTLCEQYVYRSCLTMVVFDDDMDFRKLKEIISKMTKTKHDFPVSFQSSFIGNFNAFLTKGFFSECIFTFDTYFRAINDRYSLIENPNRSADLFKAIYKKIDKPYDPLKNPIRAMTEIRNSFHFEMKPDNDICYTIDPYSFKFNKKSPHHYTTIFHLLFLFEKSMPIFEMITSSINQSRF